MTMLEEETGVLDRFRTPLYTVREAARYLDVPERTFATWAHGYRHQSTRRRMVVGLPVLTVLPKTGRRGPVIPFIGLAEGLVLTAMRRSGVPLQRIRPALAALDEQFGLGHALASERLYTDGGRNPVRLRRDRRRPRCGPGRTRACRRTQRPAGI